MKNILNPIQKTHTHTRQLSHMTHHTINISHIILRFACRRLRRRTRHRLQCIQK